MSTRITYEDVTGKSDRPFVLLTGRDGGYFLLNAEGRSTRYEGLYHPIRTEDGWDLVKSLHAIVPESSPSLIHYKAHIPTIQYENGMKLQCGMTHDSSLLCLIEKGKGVVRLPLDVHQMHDYSDFSKGYHVVQNSRKGKFLTLQYKKTGNTDYTYYVAICASFRIIHGESWRNEFYSFDARRNSAPTSLFVYDGLKGKLDGQERLVVAMDADQKKAEAKAVAAFESAHNLIQTSVLYKTHLLPCQVSEDLLGAAFTQAVYSLDSLYVTRPLGEEKYKGVYAGLPWFYQWWTRDEAISIGAFLQMGRNEEVGSILMRQLATLQEDGRLGNRFPASELGSADGIGWCAVRFLELLHAGGGQLSTDDLKWAYESFLRAKEQLEQHYMDDDLVWNRPFETWIDTGNHLDRRDGACLEIQLLHQKLNDVLALLAPRVGRRFDPINRLAKIRRRYLPEGCLIDRVRPDRSLDHTVRPNIFMAYYLYPGLLNQCEWESCFDQGIDHLWTAWGGMTSIQTDSPLFHMDYTGQNNHSYHRGDVWYYLNNMAALCLYRCNQQRYKPYIQSLLKASAREILFSGALGHHAEVSSARQQESQGCLAQAWSAALFIEAYRECSR
ncbi:MAG: amylo-alpha-1,6-glucosidase [Nanoarchaeota archaeon]